MKGQNRTLEGISIVIPTRNRVEYVQRLFTSLYSELKTFDGLAEVIIIDSSNPKNSKLIADMCKKYGYNFHFLRGSISEARNYGVKAASFPIVLFIDSDCEVVPGILQEHLESYTGEEIGGVLGLTNFIGKRDWVWRAIEKTSLLIAFSFASRMEYALWGPCANISFRKDVIEKIGGFKTEFPFDYSGEDVDIGLRINEMGYRIKCNPNAIVNHTRETWSDFWSFCEKIFRWGRTDFHILKEHPHLSCSDFPKFSTISLFAFILSIIFNIIGVGWKIAELLLIWLLCVPIMEALLKSYRAKFTDFLLNYLSSWFIFIFEFGAIFESLMNGSLLMLYNKIMYGKGQLIFEWNYKVIRGWSYVLTSIIFLFATIIGILR
jgi:cellulose synthase/poly-beta-1,6-N-acetylglucosamine synthase-like glycosyltransferase